jgi:hypothetical protein
MRLPQLVRHPSPELLFGVVQTLVWLFLAIQLSAGVVAPLAQSFAAPQHLSAE